MNETLFALLFCGDTENNNYEGKHMITEAAKKYGNITGTNKKIDNDNNTSNESYDINNDYDDNNNYHVYDDNSKK